MQAFSTCIDAMNCAMLDGMTTGISASSPTALFIHQMVPHHQNAVNMAKVLLKDSSLVCDDLSNEDDPDCAMEVILRDIVNTQNHQIQKMLRILEAKNFPAKDNCIVELETIGVLAIGEEDSSNDLSDIIISQSTVNNSGSTKQRSAAWALAAGLVAGAIVLH
jgi:Domain of unknown function (DUF305)